MTDKLCKDCAHFVAAADGFTGDKVFEYARCSKFEMPDAAIMRLVRGPDPNRTNTFRFCTAMRTLRECGPEGKLWEPRVAQAAE